MTVVGAVVVRGEGRGVRVLARQHARRERDAREDRDARLLGLGQHLIEGLETERIQDDLHIRDIRAGDRRERLSVVSTDTP